MGFYQFLQTDFAQPRKNSTSESKVGLRPMHILLFKTYMFISLGVCIDTCRELFVHV